MKIHALLLALALPLAAGACAGPADTGGGGEPTAAELGTLGARLVAEPERTDEILAEAGLDRAELEARVREVMADVDEARAYAEAFRAAGGTAAGEGEAPAAPTGG